MKLDFIIEWGRFAFRWRSYRAMLHSISVLMDCNDWKGYGDLKEFEKYLDGRFK
jgi:hypothetical protein